MAICRQMAKCFSGYLMQGMTSIARICMLNVDVRKSELVLALVIGEVEKAQSVGSFEVSYRFKRGSIRRGYTVADPYVVDGQSCLCSFLCGLLSSWASELGACGRLKEAFEGRLCMVCARGPSPKAL
ncbi:hypothetical protein GOP47_0016047 [Adiantum capillus-veneris]|uniref:Uncharacterized protein n=1 Tax=Adiantum capillus-veneris TaxID=13818 RepID=A0A9D4ZEJ1_ADICA|nr:hypothetical protein GOP47_0016047 [Adiantum capillus-veneris]